MSENNRDEAARELIEKISKAPARHVFYVDVSKQSPEQAEAYLKKLKQRFKKNN